MEKINLTEKIKSLSAKEVIMSMVNGLRNPITRIDMNTFGDIRNNICFGCAATNTLCYIGGISIEDLIKSGGEASRVETGYREEVLFLLDFEFAIDNLRQGDILGYNRKADFLDFAPINLPRDFEKLPELTNNFTAEHLAVYERLANLQE